MRRLKITADLISSVAFVDNNKPLFETKLSFATCYNEVPNNKLPRMIALYRLARRPSVQPNITGLRRFSTGVRELLSARLSARFITMLCNLIHINRNSKRSHTLTEDLLKRDIYLQIRPLPITLGEPTTSCTRPGDATHSAVPSMSCRDVLPCRRQVRNKSSCRCNVVWAPTRDDTTSARRPLTTHGCIA